MSRWTPRPPATAAAFAYHSPPAFPPAILPISGRPAVHGAADVPQIILLTDIFPKPCLGVFFTVKMTGDCRSDIS